MSSLLFDAAQIAIYTEDGVITVAFADSASPDPERYLILQQENPRDAGNAEDDYYFEINDRSMSGEGGFLHVFLDHGDLVIIFGDRLKAEYNYTDLRIVAVESVCQLDDLCQALHKVFDGTGCRFNG